MAATTISNSPGTARGKAWRWVGPELTAYSAKVTTGIGLAFDISQWKHVGFTIAGSGTAAGTVKAKIAFASGVDFNSAASPTNPWTYCSLNTYHDGAVVAGGTGIVLAADGVVSGELNQNSARYVCFEQAAYSTGAFTVKLYPVNNV